jgi:integrase
MPRTRSRLYRRKRSPFWYAVWTDASARVHNQSTGCRDHGAAAGWLSNREQERIRAEAGIPVARPVSLLEATAEYLVEHEPPIWSQGWYVTAEGMIRTQVLPHFGEELQISTIVDEDVVRFRAAQLQRTVRGGRRVSPSTVNRTLWMLSAFGAWCVARKYHLANPWSSVESLPETQAPVPTVEPAQLAQVLLALPSRWRPLVEFALETGLRKSELSRLARGDVDLVERRAWVVSSHARGLTKSRKTRSVPLSLRALEILAAAPRRTDGLVFGRVGDPRRALRRAAAAAGLERVWLHLFRHLAASSAAARGFSTADLVAFGGWSGSRMADRYTHTHHRRMLALLDAPSVRAAAGDHSGRTDPGTGTGGPASPRNRPS